MLACWTHPAASMRPPYAGKIDKLLGFLLRN